MKIKVILLTHTREVVKELDVEAEKVGTASIVVHEGQHYHYHRLVMIGKAEFIACSPPIEIP